jgi:hypothetical protein
MIERPRKTIKNKQSLNIAWREISAVLDISEPRAITHEKFEILRKYCLQKLWITEDNPDVFSIYNRIMNHYLRNGGCYFLGYNTENSSQKEIDESKKDYTLFWSVVSRVSTLTEKQKNAFLQGMKQHYDTPQKTNEKTENPIIVLDRVLSAVITG